MFYSSIYIKHVAKARKRSTSVIQNIVVGQDTINAAFIQTLTAWDCRHLNGENI